MPGSAGDLKYHIHSLNPFPSYDTLPPISPPTIQNKVSNTWKYFFSFAFYYTYNMIFFFNLEYSKPVMELCFPYQDKQWNFN